MILRNSLPVDADGRHAHNHSNCANLWLCERVPIGIPETMHISDGLLPASVCAGGYVVAAGATAMGLRWVRDRDVPRLALMTSVFFAASLIHLRFGVMSVHLILHGLVGAVAGGAAIIPIAIGVALQALLFGHGGITTIGVNTVMMGLPALLFGWMVRALLAGQCGTYGEQGTQHDRDSHGSRGLLKPGIIGFAAGSGAVVMSLLIFLGVGLTADRAFFQAIGIFVVAHIPLAVIEGLVTAAAVGFLAKVKPEIFHASQ